MLRVIPSQKKKQKIRIARADGDLVTLAGLYDYWRRGDEWIESYTILTTSPNTSMQPIHNRMDFMEPDHTDPATGPYFMRRYVLHMRLRRYHRQDNAAPWRTMW